MEGSAKWANCRVGSDIIETASWVVGKQNWTLGTPEWVCSRVEHVEGAVDVVLLAVGVGFSLAATFAWGVLVLSIF